MSPRQVVYVFNGDGGRLPSGVFTSRESAEVWIAQHRLTGVLTSYPLDQGSYEWAIETGFFRPTRDDQRTPHFIGTFSCGKDHWHYEEGRANNE